MKRLIPRRAVISLPLLVLSLVVTVLTVLSLQKDTKLPIFASVDSCSSVPAGKYNISLKTYSPIGWKLSCPVKGGEWSGQIPAVTIPFGKQTIPYPIKSGDNFEIAPTLKEICNLSSSVTPWKEICNKVCSLLDCSQIRWYGYLRVSKISCFLGAYQAEGSGDLTLAYQNKLLGSCTIKAPYSGKLLGVFRVTK